MTKHRSLLTKLVVIQVVWKNRKTETMTGLEVTGIS